METYPHKLEVVHPASASVELGEILQSHTWQMVIPVNCYPDYGSCSYTRTHSHNQMDNQQLHLGLGTRSGILDLHKIDNSSICKLR